MRADSLTDAFMHVREFQEAMGLPAPRTPTMIPAARALERHNFSAEENQELVDATTIVDQIDAGVDKLYLALGDLVELGVNPSPFFNIVQGANMAKLGPDGKPIMHPTIPGKIAKPPGWRKPEPWIEAELNRQTKLMTAGPDAVLTTVDFTPIRYGQELPSQPQVISEATAA
jgi:predicted HAD superfamily Cof-like phosphohydrolase